jgi:hypothetical protein
VINGDLPGLKGVPVNGKVDAALLTLIYTYQQRKGLLSDSKKKPADVTIEPAKGTLKNLNANPLVDDRWSQYDKTVKDIVKSLNDRYKATPGFKSLDWRWVKAMLWQETGANNKDWATKPLQIGKAGDPGLSVVKGGNDATERGKVKAVIPKDVSDAVNKGAITPELNIKAGVAYLYYRAAFPKLNLVTVDDNLTVKEYELGKDEYPSTVAGKLKTTVDVIMKDSGLTAESVKKLPKNAKIKYHPAHTEWQVSGWNDWESAIKDYNGGGVKTYLEEVKGHYRKIILVFPESAP